MGYAERDNAERAAARAAEAAAYAASLVGLRVALDVQHLYRQGAHAGDRGSRYVLPGGGVVWEAAAATAYAIAAGAYLRARGAEVLTNDPVRGQLVGPYSRRNLSAAALGVHCYVACHVNAGGGEYCSMEHVGMATSRTLLLGSDIASAVRAAFPVIRGSVFPPLMPGQRGAVCIERVAPGIATVLCEPVFGDNPHHQDALTGPGLVRLGEAIGVGIARWWVLRPAAVVALSATGSG